MEHPAFLEVGKEPGIEIWTIDQFEPVPIETKMYGKFYNGDCYIVLKTTGTKTSSLTHDAHFWLGSKATQDKMGAAAILTVTLDDMLGGGAVQHREVEGHESAQFLGYFQPAIRYLEGGSESGFNEVEINAGAEKRLLRLSGCEHMRIEEVPPTASSLTREHCFILEVDHEIFVLMPEASKATQRRKIISVANSLRDDYHNGRATIEIIDEFSPDDDIALFFEALGSGSKEDMADETDGPTGLYTRDSASAVYLYRVLDGDSIDLETLSKPYKQKHLLSHETYILDTPDSGVFVWLGKEVEPDMKKKFSDIAQQYLQLKGYPSWVNVTKVSEGSECGNFKQYFRHWDSVDSSAYLAHQTDASYFSEEPDANIAKQIGKSAAVRGFMPDQGDGAVVITRFAGDAEDVSEILQAEVAILYQSEAYVVDYTYVDGGDEGHVIYIWTGSSAVPSDKQAAAAHAAELEDEDQDSNIVVSVPQGKEPRHFLSIFKGHLAILFGSKEDGYKPTNSRDSYEDDGIRFFRVEGTEAGVDMRVTQLLEASALLEDDDVYVLENGETVYVWNGEESNTLEQEAALRFVQSVAGEKEVVVVQGEEAGFWDALGGPPEDADSTSGWRQSASQRVTVPLTLTAVNVTVTGSIRFEELAPEFSQRDLSEDGIYILDGGEELYLWQGSKIAERMKLARGDIVMKYLEDDGLERTLDNALVVAIKQAREPNVFTKKFPVWEKGMWENLSSYEDIKDATKSDNSK